MTRTEYTISLMLITVIFIIAPAVADVNGLEPALIISDYVVEPAVLMPGDIGTITVTITNTAYPSIPAISDQSDLFKEMFSGSEDTTTESSTGMETTAEIRHITLSGNEIKLIKGPTGKIKLGPSQSVRATFAIKVGSTVKDGMHFPTVVIDVKDGDDVEYSIPVSVDGSSLSMTASNIPSSIPIGRVSEIEIGIINMRPNNVMGVSITPKVDGMEFSPKQAFVDTTTKSSEAFDGIDSATSLLYGNLYGNIPTTPVSSIASSTSAVSAITSTMVPYQVSNVKFNINPTSVGSKDIIFELKYKNGNNIHVEELHVSINVVDVIDVKLVPMELPQQVTKGSIATVDFEVVNARPTKIVSVSVIPVASGIARPNERFIGTMEADDVFSAKFDIDTENMAQGKSEIGFKVLFRDELSGKTYESEVYNVPLTVVEPQQDDRWPLSVVTLAFLPFIGAYYVYKQRARRRT